MTTLSTTMLTGSALDERVSAAAAVAAILRFEVALARAQAELGMIPMEASAAIEAAAADFEPDVPAIAAAGHTFGTPVIALLEQLGTHVERRHEGARAWLHHGATSQDALDTATVLCLAPLVKDTIDALGRARASTAGLARTHERSPVLARTLLQAAGITTFGLKTAQWSAGLGRAERRVSDAAARGLTIQLAGAVGSGQAFGDRWPALQSEVARALGLRMPEGGSWQSMRDAWTNLLMQLVLATGVAVKIAGDIALMGQSEIAEVSEPPVGGATSSAMPHKQNPVLSMRIRACGYVVNGHAGTVIAASAVEHERGLGTWQAELAAAPPLVAHASSALDTLATLLGGLRFHPDRAQANIDALRGLIFADRALSELSALIPRHLAIVIVEQACRNVRESGAHLRGDAGEGH